MITQNQVALLLHPDTFYDGDENTLRWKDGHETTEAEQSTIDAEVTRLQAEYDSLAYARSRKQEYDKLPQFEMQFDDQRDGTSTWIDSINEIKERFPK